MMRTNIKEHREVINEYVEKKGYEYIGFIPVLFGPSGKTLEVDLVFKKPTVVAKVEKKEKAEENLKKSKK